MAISNNLALYGIIFIFLGIVLIIASSFTQSKTNVKTAGIVFIGPFPFGWASDKQMFYILLGITVLIIIYYLIKR